MSGELEPRSSPTRKLTTGNDSMSAIATQSTGVEEVEEARTSSIHHHGCDLAYEVRGDGPPVLLIQGVGVHGTGWKPQVDELAAYYECLSFDNRGIGQSQPGSDALTVEQMADDALALMDAEGWPTAHVIGHSLGGLVALQLALVARQRVRSLSLLCTFANGRAAAPLTRRMLWSGIRSRVGTRRMRRRGFLSLLLPPGMLSPREQDDLAMELTPLFGHDLADQPEVTNQQIDAMRTADVTRRLRELAGKPTLVVSGKHDPIAPPELGRAIARGIVGARYEEFSDASHGLPIHRAARVNTLLRNHLLDVDGR
jgi:pimeloyl-ACP methyl ester carboxylesterase